MNSIINELKKYIHIKYIIWTGQYTRQWGYSDGQARQDSCSHGEIFKRGETSNRTCDNQYYKRMK